MLSDRRTVGESIHVGGTACPESGCSSHWTEVKSWSGEGYAGLYIGQDFDLSTGRFVVRTAGLYFASSTLRIDGASAGWYSTAILTNAEPSWESGMSALNGQVASSYYDFTMAGVRSLE